MKSFISQREKHRKIGKYFSPKSTPENAHGLSQKIQGTYFKTSALYFKIYALYFSPFQMLEKQCLEKDKNLPFPGAVLQSFFFLRCQLFVQESIIV